jgi:hypothetical protein
MKLPRWLAVLLAVLALVGCAGARRARPTANAPYSQEDNGNTHEHGGGDGGGGGGSM